MSEQPHEDSKDSKNYSHLPAKIQESLKQARAIAQECVEILQSDDISSLYDLEKKLKHCSEKIRLARSLESY